MIHVCSMKEALAKQFTKADKIEGDLCGQKKPQHSKHTGQFQVFSCKVSCQHLHSLSLKEILYICISVSTSI